MSNQAINIPKPHLDADADLSSNNQPKGVMMERILHVNINNSLGNLALAGPQGGFWRLVDGTQFQTLGSCADNHTMDSSAAINQLCQADMHEVVLLEHQSTFPVALGVKMNCVPSKEFTELGDAYTYTVLPNSNLSTPQQLFKSEPLGADMVDWHKQYPQYNATNLETEGVMPVNNQSIVFIDCEHPAVGLLRANQNLIGVDIDSQKKIDNTWFKISRQVLNVCCDTIRKKILC